MKKRMGFTLVEIMIVVAIIALLTAIAIPAFLQYREDTQSSLCVNNLRLVHHGKEVVAIKEVWTNGYALLAADIAQINTYIEDAPLNCPVGTTNNVYTFNAIGTDPECPLDPNGEHTL